MARAGHSTAAAALRYQHVVSGQDEAIARYLNELVEGTQRARNADEQRTHATRKPAPVVVETMGLEPTTPCLQSRCSSQLSYVPDGATRVAGGAKLGHGLLLARGRHP